VEPVEGEAPGPGGGEQGGGPGGRFAELARRAVESWVRGNVNGALVATALLLDLAWREGLPSRVATQLAYAAVRREVVRGLGEGWEERARYFATSRNAVQYVVREIARWVAEAEAAPPVLSTWLACCAMAGAKLVTRSSRPALPSREAVEAEGVRLRVRGKTGAEEFYVRLGALVAYVLLEQGGIEAVLKLAEREIGRLARVVGGSQTGA